jgi:hypothetical protein
MVERKYSDGGGGKKKDCCVGLFSLKELCPGMQFSALELHGIVVFRGQGKLIFQ